MRSEQVSTENEFMTSSGYLASGIPTRALLTMKRRISFRWGILFVQEANT